MITMTMDFFGVDDAIKRLFLVTEEMERKIPSAIDRTTSIGAEMVTGYVPIFTGALLASVGTSPAVPTGDGWEGRVGTGSPYGRRRLDLGFHGTDSRGRNYDDQPHPAFSIVAPQLPGILARELRG